MSVTVGGADLPLVEYEIDRAFGEMDTARVFVSRPSFQSVSVQTGETEVSVSDGSGVDQFGGVLRDFDRQGSVVELLVDSFERYAKEAEPTSSSEQWDNVPDADVVRDAVDSVGLLSRGSISSVGSVSFVFSHASQAYKIREVARSTGAEVVYRPDKSVDYLPSGGRGNVKSTVIGPDEGNVVGDFVVERRGGRDRVSHLRVIGAGEGKHQITSEVVASWYGSGRKSWKVVSNKSITDQSTLDKYANSLIKDLNTEDSVKVRATIDGPSVSLGDQFQFENPDENLDTQLRVVELTELFSSDGKQFRVVATDRRDSREEPSTKERLDSSRYNRAFEGNSVTINSSGGRRPVTPDSPYLTKLYFPGEVKYEHRLNLRVMGLPYRAYSQGGASSSAGSTNIVPQSAVIGDSDSNLVETISYPDGGG